MSTAEGDHFPITGTVTTVLLISECVSLFPLPFPHDMRDAAHGRMGEEINDQKIKNMSSFTLVRRPPCIWFKCTCESLTWLSLAAAPQVRMDRGLCMDYLVPGAALNKQQLNRTWQNTKDDTLSSEKWESLESAPKLNGGSGLSPGAPTFPSEPMVRNSSRCVQVIWLL